MSAAATVVHHHHVVRDDLSDMHQASPGPSARENGLDASAMSESVAADITQFWSEQPLTAENVQNMAARTIQNAAFPRLIANRTRLKRVSLLERVTLELRLQRGFRLLGLCAMLFAFGIYASIIESQSDARIGLLKTYKSLFFLDDSLADIKTQDSLLEYFRTVSQQSRLLQPASSVYFNEDERAGTVKVFPNMRSFVKPDFVAMLSLKPRVDSPSFSMVAWIKLSPRQSANVLRKPLGKLPNEKGLSCWGWSVGYPHDRFDYGAHDFRGGYNEKHLQESVASNRSSRADDGKLHHVAVVVTQKEISFWLDAELQSKVALPRPVTDCTGIQLQIGDVNVQSLGEIVFFPRALDETGLKEMLFAGFTLHHIASGRLPYEPEQTPTDIMISRTDSAFADAQGEREAAALNLAVENVVSRATVQATKTTTTPAAPKTLTVAEKAGCTSVKAFQTKDASTGAVTADDTSCYIIDDWTGASQVDSLNGNKNYYNLLPPSVRPAGAGPKDALYTDQFVAKKYTRYDAAAFPSWCGQSATFST
jgi:hypothetical protein